MSTYIPRQVKPIRERVEAKLDRDLIVQLEQYCEYLLSERDYVIAQALTVAFRKDKGFTEWQQTHPKLQPGREATEGMNTPKTRSQK